MKQFNTFLTLYSWILSAEAQNQNQYLGGTTMIPDQIYFVENPPQVNRLVPAINENKVENTVIRLQNNVENQNKQQNGYLQGIFSNTNIGSQNNVGNQNKEQDSYLQGIFSNTNNGQQNSVGNKNKEQDSYLQGMFLNTNSGPQNNVGSSMHQLNLELQPPLYNMNSNPNYYEKESSTHIVNASVTPLELNRSQVPNQKMSYRVSNESLAIINFGLNLLKNIDQRASNVVISPYSIATLLALLQQGALGATQKQISAALQMSPEISSDAFKTLNELFQKRSSRIILRVANNVFVADAFDLNPAFKRVAMQYFGSEVTPIRFTKPEDAVKKINHWVAARTNNKIEELLTPDAVGGNSQVVLVNAVYFKGPWQVRFKPESTLPREFYLSDGNRKVVPFLRMRRIFRTGIDRNNDGQVIILPFENEQYSLVIMLPSETTNLNAVVSTLTDSQLAAYQDFTPKEVDLELPKFTVRGDTELDQVLKKMGVTNIFTDQSELSGVGTYQTYAPQVSRALHTAMLSIDEDGGTAAAATAFAVVALSYDDPSVLFKVNRPFLAVLWDNEAALPLFMAKIDDPVA